MNNNDEARNYDLVCLGRVAVDLYAEQIHSKLSDAQTFRKYVGGCAGNVAIGASRMGLKSLMLSKVGQDDMGDYIIDTLQEEGVETSFISKTSDHLTGLVLLGVSPPNHFPLMFYREQCADMQMTLNDCQLPWSKVKSLLLTGTGFSTLSMRNVSRLAVSEAKANHVKVILDLDFRPVLWGLVNKGDGETRYQHLQELSKIYAPFLKAADLVVGTEEEFLVASGQETVEKACQVLRSLTDATLVLKKGVKGCTILHLDNMVIECPGFAVKVLNVLGAGDAFLSGFLKGWLNDEPLKLCAHYGNGAGAIVVSRHGCAPAIPYFKELQYFLTQKDTQQAVNSTMLAKLHYKHDYGIGSNQQLAMLAFDHRTQFEQSLEGSSLPSSMIQAFKNKVFEGLLQVKKDWDRPHIQLGCLMDSIYSSSIFERPEVQSLLVGYPIEKANQTPLEWIQERPLYEQLLTRPKKWLVKVLVHMNTSMSLAQTQTQIKQLIELNQSCERLNRSWMLELLSDDLCASMKTLYQRGLCPTWWKIPCPESKQHWDEIDKLVQSYDPNSKVVVLGLGADLDALEPLLKLARQSATCQGLVIGRSVFWPAWQSILSGNIELSDVPDLIEMQWMRLIAMWQQAAPKMTVKEGCVNEVFID